VCKKACHTGCRVRWGYELWKGSVVNKFVYFALCLQVVNHNNEQIRKTTSTWQWLIKQQIPNNTDENRYIVINEVEIMAWSDSHRAATTASYTSVRLMQRLVDKDKRWDDSVTVTQRLRNTVTDWHDIGWRYVLNTHSTTTSVNISSQTWI